MFCGSKKRKWLAAALALALVPVLLSSCSQTAGADKTKIKAIAVWEAGASDAGWHCMDTDKLIYVAESGLIRLYLDPKTYGIAIEDTSANKLWLSLPAKSEGELKSPAHVLKLRLSKGGEICELNSQDHSAALDGASFEPLENGLKVTYKLAPDAKTAENGGADGAPYAEITVDYLLADGNLYAKINCAENQVAEGWLLESVELLGFFGSSAESERDDFILLPDGSGAVLSLAGGEDKVHDDLRFAVYGRDPAVAPPPEDGKVQASALLGFYGIKQGDSAYVALIRNGDMIATVFSRRKSSTQPVNRAAASFAVTDVLYSGKFKYAGSPYAGEIELCFRFLSKKNADYSGMAAACREQLIRSAVLSTQTVEESEHIPFLLSLWGAVSRNGGGACRPLSTWEQTAELLKRMKAKSINKVALRCRGALAGAGSPYLLSKAKELRELGGRKDFDALSQYMQTQQFELYLDLDIAAFNRRGPDGAGAVNLKGGAVRVTEPNPFSMLGGRESFRREALSLSRVRENVCAYVNNSKAYPFGGYAIHDAGRLLYSDYSASGQSRADAAGILSEQAQTLASGHKLMVDGGNFYLLKNADFAAGLPCDTAYPQSGAYAPVPFVEMILHGIVDYSLSPVNLAKDGEWAFLKSLEYGALPSYEWYCEKTGFEILDSIYCCEGQLGRAAENYLRADEVLGDLRGARMTAHYKVEDGVYCAEYNDSSFLYFNYNREPRTVRSLTLAPLSCLRVN